MKLGIVGLPNVGKSTLFNALTSTQNAQAANYPFCTIEPNSGIVPVPDPRLDKLAEIWQTDKKTPAIVEFVDIAGLVKGASQGAGLGNKFLGHIRECDAIVHVVRCFDDDNIIHVVEDVNKPESVDPIRDIDAIDLELILADLEVVSNRLGRQQKAAKTGNKAAAAEAAWLTDLAAWLEGGRPARSFAFDESDDAVKATRNAMRELDGHDEKRAESIREDEQSADKYEDELGTYLVKLSGCPLSDQDRVEAAELLHMIGDFERISDHAVNVLEATEELRGKGITFSDAAMDEMHKLFGAVSEIMDLALTAFIHGDLSSAKEVEPLEQVVDTLKEQLRSRHILRLQEGKCSMEAGFVWSDLLTDLERVADHCSNIAGCVVQMQKSRMDIHGYLDGVRSGSDEYRQRYDYYARKYALA